MASSSCVSESDLFTFSLGLRKGQRQSRRLPGLVLSANPASGLPRFQLLFRGNILDEFSCAKKQFFCCPWRLNIKEASEDHYTPSRMAATATSSWLFLSEEAGNFHLSGPDSNFQIHQSSADDTPKLDDREKLRRMKISKANKGKVPWNKGKKHSAVTIQRIRERTKIAMQDPKVKRKLLMLGHAQSQETRTKIGIGVREGWRRRHVQLLVQESCFSQWHNMIAEASRKGYAGGRELRWDSYEILDKQLKQEWLESVEKRKMVHRPKGSKRAPKSPEQRRKISEAISAKWADPGYRARVCTALAKYHSMHAASERKQRKRANGEALVGTYGKKKVVRPEGINGEANTITSSKSCSNPSFRDPMASSKFDMIKKIRERREATETRKREATKRAKLLVAEAERAAIALEVAALRSPLAQASLLETRKLLAEANQYIRIAEDRQLANRDTSDGPSSNISGFVEHSQGSIQTPGRDLVTDQQRANSHYQSSIRSSRANFTGRHDASNTKNSPLSTEAPMNTTVSQEHGSAGKGIKKKWVHGKLVEVQE
ncbi:uncharacterized protein [Typha latifolia]|uniref:uncharacterized protein isoform X2 n=1 Tax=Typha latifolia TaxID=4733 RepID=UPI003C2CF363